MDTALWVVLAVAVVFALAYVLAMRNVLRESREKYKKMDRTKLREWKDEEEDGPAQ